ncbi:Replication initiator protein A [Variovorax sp. SRS16]|uniref:replication initiator protein A n=1 Tax=Variovorax sp. SRS16 TaxID=282217 RepID=UPI001316E5EB|nr:replication initiator protein A [Variovorax sp. SRS16]VTU31644.1 Replication initiator protein A [Variovorax sp. SRS16]
MSKRSSEREQLQLFRALPAGGMAPRDAQDLMAYPFFSLAKSRRVVPIRFEAGGILLTVEGVPEHGIATIWDADVLIWAASQIVQARDDGIRPSRLMAATPYEILRFAQRGTGQTDYRMLKAALDRLQSTTVATSIRQPAGKRLHRFSWINEWKEHLRADGRSDGIELILADWFFSGVMDNALVLTLDPAYFRLSGGIERWLYRLVRKHGGKQQAGWRFDLRHLYVKSASLQRYSDFALQLRRLVHRQSLPGYWLAIERAGGTEWLRFRSWPRSASATDLSTAHGEDSVEKLWPDSGNRPHGSRVIARKGLG